MIVDDNKSFRVALRHILDKNKNYEILCEAENGKQALELSDTHIPDIILMDIEMPEMNGIKAAKHILWQNSNIKIIAITMYKEKVYLDEIMSAGFRACVFKSDVFDQIHSVIEEVNKNKYIFPKGIQITTRTNKPGK